MNSGKIVSSFNVPTLHTHRCNSSFLSCVSLVVARVTHQKNQRWYQSSNHQSQNNGYKIESTPELLVSFSLDLGCFDVVYLLLDWIRMLHGAFNKKGFSLRKSLAS